MQFNINRFVSAFRDRVPTAYVFGIIEGFSAGTIGAIGGAANNFFHGNNIMFGAAKGFVAGASGGFIGGGLHFGGVKELGRFAPVVSIASGCFAAFAAGALEHSLGAEATGVITTLGLSHTFIATTPARPKNISSPQLLTHEII